MKKIKGIVLVLVVVFGLALSSCGSAGAVEFVNGVYNYVGDNIDPTADVSVKTREYVGYKSELNKVIGTYKGIGLQEGLDSNYINKMYFYGNDLYVKEINMCGYNKISTDYPGLEFKVKVDNVEYTIVSGSIRDIEKANDIDIKFTEIDIEVSYGNVVGSESIINVSVIGFATEVTCNLDVVTDNGRRIRLNGYRIPLYGCFVTINKLSYLQLSTSPVAYFWDRTSLENRFMDYWTGDIYGSYDEAINAGVSKDNILKYSEKVSFAQGIVLQRQTKKVIEKTSLKENLCINLSSNTELTRTRMGEFEENYSGNISVLFEDAHVATFNYLPDSHSYYIVACEDIYEIIIKDKNGNLVPTVYKNVAGISYYQFYANYDFYEFECLRTEEDLKSTYMMNVSIQKGKFTTYDNYEGFVFNGNGTKAYGMGRFLYNQKYEFTFSSLATVRVYDVYGNQIAVICHGRGLKFDVSNNKEYYFVIEKIDEKSSFVILAKPCC